MPRLTNNTQKRFATDVVGCALICIPGGHNFDSGAHFSCQILSDLGDRLSNWLRNVLSRVVWQPTPSQRGGGRPPPWPAPRMRVHMYTQEAFMLFSDLTVLHEHQQMNMRKDFVHKKCGFTGRFHPSWPMHSVPERTRVWTLWTKEVCRRSMSDGFRATAIVIVSGPLERGRTPPCDLLSSPLRPSVSRSVEFLQCTCSGHIDLSYACLGIPHLQEYLSSCRHPVPIVAHPQVPLPATPRLPATPPLQLACTVPLSGRPHRPTSSCSYCPAGSRPRPGERGERRKP